MIRVGIVGLGFMGKMHFRCYKALENVELAAICDINESVFQDAGGTAGNIAGAEKPLDLTGIELYTDFKKMLKKANLDAVSITLPTYLHAEYTVKALRAGLNVLCEKPMALNTRQCKRMLTAAEESGKILQIGHCIRFWPEYVKTKEIIDSGEYGKILSATFRRLSMTPIWSWNNWILDVERSGAAALDLHIHDTDYVQYVFGVPKAVTSFGFKGESQGYDQILTHYHYEDGKNINAEGGWIFGNSFGFTMSFDIAFEKATICYDCNRTPAFKVCPQDGDAFTPEVLPGDGYSREIEHFVKIVQGQSLPAVTTPEQSMMSVKLIELENKSATTGRTAAVK